MTDNIDLDALKRPELTESGADVLRILNDALTSQADPAATSAKLARDLREHVSQKSESSQIASDILWDLWAILLDVVRVVPIDHPWHEVLIEAVVDLRREGGPVAGSSDTSLKWEDLPQLSMYLLDKWADPTDLDDHTPEDIETWKRLNSFASHLVSHGFQSLIVLAYWELSAGLETTQDAAMIECKLWVATEWLIRCGSILFQDLNSTEELDDRALASIKPGPLCEADIPPRSVQRWDLWPSRLVDLTKESSTEDTAQNAVLSASSLARLEQAIAAMHRSRSHVEAEGQTPRAKDSSETVGN